MQGEVRADQSRTRLHLLREFTLHLAGCPVHLPWSARRLLAFLALQDRPLHRLHIAGVLWPETNEYRARASLRSTLWRLNRISSTLVLTDNEHLQLAPSTRIDYREALVVARLLLKGWTGGSSPPRADSLSTDLLPDWTEEWVIIERERYRQLRLHALEALNRHLTEDRHYADAVETAFVAIAAEPLRETAHRSLITTLIAEGNRVEAIRRFEALRRLLRDELGVEPSFRLEDVSTDLSRVLAGIGTER